MSDNTYQYKFNELEKYILAEAVLVTYYGWKIHPEYKYETNCAICMDDLYHKYVIELPCGHDYDYECIISNVVDFKRLKCPNCNEPFRYINQQ